MKNRIASEIRSLMCDKKRFIIRIVEKVCEDLGIDRFKIYNMPYLLTRLKYKMVNTSVNKRKDNNH